MLGIPAGVVLQVVFVDALYWLLGPLYRWLFEQTSSSWFEIDRLDEPARGITDRASGPASIAVLFILLVIGAPLIEELLFRGLVLRSFTARNKDSIALVLASVLFAFGHFQPLQFPALVMFGLVVGFVALKTKRLGASVFIHVGFNAATTIALLLA